MSKSSANKPSILTTVDDVFFILDKNWHFEFINKSAEIFFKKKMSKLLSKKIWDEYPLLKKNSFYKACLAVKKNDKAISLQEFYANVNIWYEKNIYPSANGYNILFRNITKIKDAERATALSNERFDIAAKATNDMIWDWNLLTDELWWNFNYNKLFGYKKAGITHTIADWVKNVYPQDRDRVKNGIFKVIEQKKQYWTDEYRYIKKDGTILYIYDRGYVLYDKDGKPYRMIGSMLDITDRILAEEKIKQSEEKYRTLVDQASDAIYIVDTKGKILTVNPSACKLSKYTEAELLSMNVYQFVLEEDIKKAPFKFKELSEGKTVIIERRLKAKDGTIVNIETIANMLSDGRILIFARNIEERIKAQYEILKEKNFSESIINSLPGIFYLHDDKGTFLKWNKNFEKVTGYKTNEIKTAYPTDFFVPEDRDRIKKEAKKILENANLGEAEASFLTKKHLQIPYYFTGTRLIIDNKPCIVVIGIDSTEKKAAELQLQKSYQEIRSLATHLTHIREEERKRIGREIHDELGQQLTAVKMDIAWIDKNIENDKLELKKKIKNIITLLDSSNVAVRRILSELGPGIIDNHGLIAALERLNTQFVQTTNYKVQFKTNQIKIQVQQDIANGIFRVYQEALTNIMRYAQATKVYTSLQTKSNTIELIIEDNGNGFDLLENKKQNTFGLLGMKERVLSHGGTFTIDSQKSKGTKITVVLPYKK